MGIFGGIADYLIPFLVVLTVLVFVHELGHYLLARRNGVRVDVFSIGFGPEIFGRTDKAGTRWKFSLIPLGGYVKMFGDANAASQPGEAGDVPPELQQYAFQYKRLRQRAWIVAAGPLANFLFAIVVLAGLFMIYGQPYTPPVVGQVQSDSAAAQAGIQPGDRIVAIDGASIERFEEVQRIVRLNPDSQLTIAVRRDGERVEVSARPTRTEVTDNFGNEHVIGLLGVTRSGMEYRRHGPIRALLQAGEETAALTVGTLQAVGQIISGTRSAEELGGPIRIAQMSGEVADTGTVNLIWFMAVLSINLGLINLFPIPMLDGGHLLFYAIEAVRGRPLGERAQEYGFRIGLALVLTLMLFVTWNDLVQLQVVAFFKQLVT
ncbi:RIP metalloprotease RseP [Ferruginivarius sediminum]|uniref:Zinc metalloprotease n=1 Tax=Ferruginivarius sediminum TaxID=2661937 RepID=A0A369TBF5_9PROT|nr:RIP metalloprotease RseP [Ferruginivarius sediminum]RDD62182.1 RIP metalloprotease RseP [Ferruginivarius sediminum]